MTTTITVPDFQYAAMYYPEVYEILIQSMRLNVDEITDEDEAEPYIQMLRSVALGSHLNTVLLDMVAKEGYLPTAKLRASVKRLLELIDYYLAQASPASADLVIQLNGTITATQTITAPGAQVSTQSTADTPAIPYEDIDGTDCARTDELTAVFAYDSTGAAYVDHTTAANAASTPWTPDYGVAPEVGDMLYYIHADAMWDELVLYTTTLDSGISAALEYFDDHSISAEPDNTTNQGSDLRVEVDGFLGTTNERTGATIRVTCLLTGASEDLVSAYDGSNYIVTTAFLGQVSPSTAAADYSITAEWCEVENTDIDVPTVPDDMTITWDLPQGLARNWQKTTVNSVEGYTLRSRIFAVSTPVAGVYENVAIDGDGLYVLATATQGITRNDDPLGSSSGLADQEFSLTASPVIDDTTMKVYVDEGSGDIEYYRQDNFLSSLPTDRHFTVAFNDDGEAKFTFANGTSGKIPPAGVDNIRSPYRTMDEVDGNVGANAINQNQSGSSFISKVWNPRPASGYQAREGGTDASLKLAKTTGVAALRTGSTAASPEEVETLTLAYKDAAGSRPFTRVLAIEEGFGLKTIEAVLVAAGGVAPTTAQKTALEAYFNSDTVNKEYGVLVMNNQVTGSNYIPKTIDVTATVYGGNKTAVETALTAFLDPEATDENGDWVWDFGEEVPLSMIITEISNTTPKPRKVTLTLPAGDTTLVTRELPKVGTLLITIVP
jgi:hypothetical protein